MKISRGFSGTLLAVCLWALPAHAIVAIYPPRPPGPAPAGWVYRYIAPVYQSVTDRTWIPDRFDVVADWVPVGPNRWEQVFRQIIIPGHYETTTRQVLVAAGYWQLVHLDPTPIPVPLPRPIVVNPGSVGVEGYPSAGSEDLSKFSPLTEWPK